MKKTLITTCLLFAISTMWATANAQTGKEVLQACVSAMKLDKMVDSFQTMSIKTYIYQTGKKIIVKIYRQENADKESLFRIEQSVDGKEEAYVYSEVDEEFFKVVPQYEAQDLSDASGMFQIINMMFPQTSLPQVARDTTDKLIIDLVGAEEFNGKKCKKIGIAAKDTTTADKPEYIQYFYVDEVTNWLHGAEMPMQKVQFVLENMKKVKGVVYPAAIKVMVDGNKVSDLEIDKLEANIELDAALFAKPN